MKKQPCSQEKNEIKNGLKNGIISAIVPHIGCIAFITLTLLGVSAGSVFLKKFILASWSFPVLFFLSFLLASISSLFYFKKNCCENKTKYISILLGSVIMVNGLLFYVVFPWVANINGKSSGGIVAGLSEIKLKVNIPCTGHASLIVDELKFAGVTEVVYSDPDEFDVMYDSSKITKDSILNLAVLKDFKAVEI
jgi:hypothetical protein